jgi:4-amino-4-deoxy-L-arabinose transferase-like glycosyltransferase
MQHQKLNVRYAWIIAALIALAVMGKYLFIGTRSSLWDRDEPRFARAVVEMNESGNYLVPTFNGQMWPDKPILTYWLMSSAIALFGPTDFAFRFWGAAGTAISCLLTFFIGQRLWGAKAGLWAMLILASTLMMLVIGTAATADAILLPFLVGALAIFVQAPPSGMRAQQIILMGIALGFGMLAKGPIGLLPVPVMLTVLWLNRKDSPGVKRCLWQVTAALILGGLIFTAWVIPANRATGGEFMRIFVGRHVLARALRPMEHHGGNIVLYFPYYLLVVIGGFFPWTLHLPGALSAAFTGRLGGKYCRRLLVGWIVPVLIIMTLAATKLPHYILFIWPGLALAAGATIVAAQQNTLSAGDRVWLRRGVWFFAPLAIALSLGLMIGPWFLPFPGLRWSGLASGIVLLVMSVVAAIQQRIDRPQVSADVLLIGMLAFEIPILFGLLPALEQMKISPPIAQAVKSKTTKETPVATYKFGEPSLNFYVGRQIETLRSEEAVVSWAQQPGPGVLIVPKDVFDRIRERNELLPLGEIASKKGFNYSKGTMLEVQALVRKQGNP